MRAFRRLLIYSQKRRKAFLARLLSAHVFNRDVDELMGQDAQQLDLTAALNEIEERDGQLPIALFG